MIYLQCEDAVRLRVVERTAALLAPGGWFIAEGFARAGAGDEAVGPNLPDRRYDLPRLIEALPGFRVVEAFEGWTLLDEGERHRGPARVARLLAQDVRPA